VTNNLVCVSNDGVHPTADRFDKLTTKGLKELRSIASPLSYPAGVCLFSESQPSLMAFMVIEGEVKLSINSSVGRRLILRVARKGEIVGISSALSGSPSDMTAETSCPATLAPIERHQLLRFLLRHPAAYQAITAELSHEFSAACEQLRMLGLSITAPEKLARLLLEWSKNGKKTESGTRCQLSLTHDEIGELIGASRETVTRAMSVFRNRRLVTFEGSKLFIPSRTALEKYSRG
jgi:CRP/FNR family cyclic AMP-dependent transcriptional regulator